jgi:diadenosine tetraphosphate (Ap4A) HIT family hydrolase
VSTSCPFCNPDPDRVFLVRPRLLGIWDAYPVAQGHALILPTRHIPDLASATAEEREGLWDLIDPVMTVIAKQHGPVDGFNIGMNGGVAAGQTVPHLHMHVIPRRHGDVADPRGGVRYVIPEKANYLAIGTSAPPTADAASPGSRGEPTSDDQVDFLTQIQRLLAGGSFSASYKYALLLALADLSVEQGGDDVGELTLSTDAIAEKFIEYYWEKSRPFVAAGAAAPRPGKTKAEKVVALLADAYGAVDGNLPALRADDAAWFKLLRAVRTVVQNTPLWKLQTVADEKVDFLYPSVGRGSEVTLRAGVAFCLRRFHGLVGRLVRGVWGDWVRAHNRDLAGDAAGLEEFLFGPRQKRIRAVAPLLYELQKGRCFYSGKEIARLDQGVVDRFIPFSRYPHDFAHNLVFAGKRASVDKCDHLAAEDHLAAWCERNAQVGSLLGDACTAAGIASDLARMLAVARWAYSQADRSETPVWNQGATLERRLSGSWREILDFAFTS